MVDSSRRKNPAPAHLHLQSSNERSPALEKLVEGGTTWNQLLADQVRRHSRLFFSLAYDVLGDVQAAEDACQQALLKAWEQRDGIRDAASLKAWLVRVVVNESLQGARRRKAEGKLRSAYPNTRGPGIVASDRAEIHEEVMRSLEELGEETRLVTFLRLVEGMSGNEVKGLLGCSASEVSRRLHQGLEHLRQHLADLNPRR
jgi:RNA polymerase sigma-70 factor (ECF subfamily)